MSISNITGNMAASGTLPVSKKDNESDLKRQKSSIEKKLSAVSSDTRLTEEEKKQESARLNEKLRGIEDEMRNASITKNQDGQNASVNEKAKSAASDMKLSRDDESKEKSDKKKKDEAAALKEKSLSDMESGIIVSLSSNKTMLENMQQVRTKINGEMLTAESDEEKEAIQKKMNRIESKMSSQIKEAKRNLDRYQKGKRQEEERKVREREKDDRVDLTFLSEKENLSTVNKSDSSLGMRYNGIGAKDPVQVVLN